MKTMSRCVGVDNRVGVIFADGGSVTEIPFFGSMSISRCTFLMLRMVATAVTTMMTRIDRCVYTVRVGFGGCVRGWRGRHDHWLSTGCGPRQSGFSICGIIAVSGGVGYAVGCCTPMNFTLPKPDIGRTSHQDLIKRSPTLSLTLASVAHVSRRNSTSWILCRRARMPERCPNVTYVEPSSTVWEQNSPNVS